MGEGEKGKNTREIQTRCLIQLSSNKSQNQSSQQRKEYMYQEHRVRMNNYSNMRKLGRVLVGEYKEGD